MLSAKLARRAKPPLGVWHPQGLVFPFTSVVERMVSLDAGEAADAGVDDEPAPIETATAAKARIAMRSGNRARNPLTWFMIPRLLWQIGRARAMAPAQVRIVWSRSQLEARRSVRIWRLADMSPVRAPA